MSPLHQTPDERRQLFSRINTQLTPRDRKEWNRFLAGIKSIVLDLHDEAQYACDQGAAIRILVGRLKERLVGVPFLEGDG